MNSQVGWTHCHMNTPGWILFNQSEHVRMNIACLYCLELFTNLVFSICIGWYFPGIYHLGLYILASKFWREPLFPSKKGVFGPLLEHSAPLLRAKGFPMDYFKKRISRIFKKEFPPNPTVQKIPTGYTNRLELVLYRYRPDGRYWDVKQQYYCCI
jgi:hypothetical protein